MSDDFSFSEEELAELRLMFFEQATEVVDSLGELILAVERDPSNVESLRSVRRAVHTLKGDSSAFGFTEITSLAHHYEDALDHLREREQSASVGLINLLLAGADALAVLIKYYRGDGPAPDTQALIEGLTAIKENISLDANADDASAAKTFDAVDPAQTAKTEDETGSPITLTVIEETEQSKTQKKRASRSSKKKETSQPKPSVPKKRATSKAKHIQLVETPTTVASNDATLFKPTSEASKPTVKPQLFVEKRTGEDRRTNDEDRRSGEDRRAVEDRRSIGAEPDRQQPADQRSTHSPTLRVESERIDNAMNLVGELIIQRSMIATLIGQLESKYRGDPILRRLNESISITGRTVSELQESVMRMRLVAIDQVFRRFPRAVRDASLKLNKPLALKIEGGQTEIDKSIVEIISDPLIHLIRNSCDHGIEAPEVRRERGKPEEGTIHLRARRAGNRISVEIEDDGGGINMEKVVAKAIEKRLVTAQEISDWTDQQKFGLLFLPGFSTAEQVSDMSGRGVGMDVVKTTVDSLGGSITVWSQPGQGSKFTIKLPLTMAIVRAMLFSSAGRRFALPLDSIHEITRLGTTELKTINGNEVLRLRDKVLPLIRVDQALGLRSPGTTDSIKQYVFVVDTGDGREVGIAVERLHGEQELVLKTIDDSFVQSEAIAGASILGDGEVVLILDALILVQQNSSTKNRQAA